MDLHRVSRTLSLPRRARALLLAAAVLTVLAAGASWQLTGGSWAVITTPSMGQEAPVGTFVLTRPVDLDAVRVGDVVSYHPTNLPGQLVTHRVIARDEAGLQVKGDVNGAPDPLPVTEDDLVGVVVHRWYGVGWLLRAAPAVLLAATALAALTGRFLRPARRSSARVLGACLIVAGASLLLRPLVRPVVVAVTTTPGADDRAPALADVVSAGLLPSRLTGAHGQYLDLTLGQHGALPVVAEKLGGPMTVAASPHLTGWWLVGMLLACSLPLVWTTTVGLAPDPEPGAA